MRSGTYPPRPGWRPAPATATWSAGAGFADVVKLGLFVTDMAYLPALRAARDAVVDTTRPPASTAVQVAALVRPEFLIEVDALAVVAD